VDGAVTWAGGLAVTSWGVEDHDTRISHFTRIVSYREVPGRSGSLSGLAGELPT
jgi:hypothetical protein